ncbi:MAG: 30S ribosomal protein S20, partial [Gemmatimonadetes bacterium]|nr:30S ribosomal protein S20 [Gemmatimonadota bacterium]
MANIKSAKKRIRTSEIRASRNKAQRSRLKTLVKRVRQA